MTGSGLASPLFALSLVARIGAVGVAVSSLEVLRRRRDLAPGGMLDGEVHLMLSRHRWLADRLASYRTAVLLVTTRLLAAAALLAGGGDYRVARPAIIVLAVATLLFRWRNPLAIHAIGSMAMITSTAAAIGVAVGTRQSVGFALAFITGQACLSYFVAGSAKLRTPLWRRGVAVGLILSTMMWGGRRTEALLVRAHPRVGWVLCWTTMVGECAVPLALVVPLPVTIAIIAMAATFHLANAIELGLNNFVWTFGSTYPAIFFSWYWLHGVRPA